MTHQLRENVRENNIEVVKLLIDSDADIHTENNIAIKSASRLGYLEIVEFLLANGADFTANDNYALRYAVAGSHFEIVEALLNAGADIHANNDEALRKTIDYQGDDYQGNVEMLNILIQNGANVRVLDDYPIKTALINNDCPSILLLLSAGVPLEVLISIAEDITEQNEFRETINSTSDNLESNNGFGNHSTFDVKKTIAKIIALLNEPKNIDNSINLESKTHLNQTIKQPKC